MSKSTKFKYTWKQAHAEENSRIAIANFRKAGKIEQAHAVQHCTITPNFRIADTLGVSKEDINSYRTITEVAEVYYKQHIKPELDHIKATEPAGVTWKTLHKMKSFKKILKLLRKHGEHEKAAIVRIVAENPLKAAMKLESLEPELTYSISLTEIAEKLLNHIHKEFAEKE